MKNKLRNKMSDEYLNDCLVTFIEKEFFNQVKVEDVINLPKRQPQSYIVKISSLYQSKNTYVFMFIHNYYYGVVH